MKQQHFLGSSQGDARKDCRIWGSFQTSFPKPLSTIFEAAENLNKDARDSFGQPKLHERDDPLQ